VKIEQNVKLALGFRLFGGGHDDFFSRNTQGGWATAIIENQ
jgi:hypothetical protein